MRLLPILSIVCLTAAAPALAQVTVDLHALEALPQRPETRPPQRRAPAAATRPRATVPAETQASQDTRPAQAGQTQTEQAQTGQSPAGQEATQAAQDGQPAAPSSTGASEPMPIRVVPPAPAPALPETVPQTAAITPVAPPPAPGAPPPPPVSAKAGTVASPTSAGLRVTFAPDQSDLSPESVAAIKKLTSEVKLGDETTYNVSAYAPGKPDDPSTARRLSLSRAMAVRSALVADGVPSPRIFVRALGAEYGKGPADRVDVDVTGAATAAATPEAPSK